LALPSCASRRHSYGFRSSTSGRFAHRLSLRCLRSAVGAQDEYGPVRLAHYDCGPRGIGPAPGIFVLANDYAMTTPRLNFEVQHLLGLKEALIGCFVAMSFSWSVVEVFGD
jgi:hypothetical protein